MTHFDSVMRWVVAALLGGWCGLTTVAMAGPLNLSNVPLFLASSVEPNILLVLDDSGSMDWEVITQDFANDGRYTGTQPDGSSPVGAGNVRHRDSDDDGVPDCGFGLAGNQTIYGYAYGVEFPTNTYQDDDRDCNTADDEEWRFRNSDFNPLYFDPNKTYLPWDGVDAAGQPYQDMNVSAAKDNPYDPNSRTIDLLRHNSNWDGGYNNRATSDRDGDGRPDGFRYYTWSDVNRNGLFDDGEETVHFIKDQPASVQQNFANWFSYNRKREYVTKAVYSHIIAGATGVRMGLATFNRNRNNINTAITSPDRPLRSMNANPRTGNKRALFDALFSIRGDLGTPLRSTLGRVGQYFENAESRPLFPDDDAYLSAAQGGSCQQSFAILMTDGFDNGAASRLGNIDGDNTSAFDGGPYADNVSNTLADVAMFYYERDLRTGLPNLLSTTTADPAPHQHLATYTVTFSGLSGSIASDPGPTVDGRTFWTNPFVNDQNKIDDLRHAAFNGRGLFFQANDVTSLTEALSRAFSSIAQRTSSAASVALNTGSRSTDSRIYQARFDSTDWSGQILSILLDPNTGTPSRNLADTIDSGALLDALLRDNNYNTNVRTIITWKPSISAGIPFQWPLLDAAQQSLLHLDISGRVDNEGEARVDYLRGSNVDEVGSARGRGFRQRLHRLGDVINSTPFFVDAPQLSDAVDPSGNYAAFRERHAARPKMLAVGSNDGMLHIFNANAPITSTNARGDAQAGKEILAYVPNLVMQRLSALTSPNYATQHQYYVDGSPTAGDAVLTPVRGASGWHTVLVGGLRGGGQGYFALNITDPTRFQETSEAAENLVLWEFSDADDADLGFSFSQPQIVRMANGKWAAVVGNGYNSTVADGHASSTGHGVLFIIFLDPPSGGRWIEGVHYVKIDTGMGDVTTPNGLATPAVVDLDGDFTADFVVAGDLRGNLWRFDVTSATPSDWSQAASVSRVLVATDSAGVPQPITTRPEVGAHPENRDGFVIYVGTGKYLERDDNTTIGATTQTFYGIWDLDGRTVARSDLLQQTFTTETIFTDVNGNRRLVRVTSDSPIDWQQQRGWYIDLPAPGERQVSDSVLRNGRIVFTTLIPNDQACSFGGSGFLVALDVNGGTRPRSTIFDVNRDRTVSHVDNAPATQQVINALGSDIGIIGTPTIQASGATDTVYSSGSTGGLTGEESDPGPAAVGRQAWRQITQ